MPNYFKIFYNDYFDRPSKITLLFCLITILISAIYFTINQLYFQYSGNFYLPIRWIELLPIALLLFIFASVVRDISPRSAFFIKYYCLWYFIIVSLAVMSTGIQFTPFPLIDKTLVQIDQLLGFYTIPVLNWTYSINWFQHFMNYVYVTIGLQLLFIPAILAIMMDKRGLTILYYSVLISFLIGSTIYYFFPTAGPTAVFHNPYFKPEQHDTWLKFYEVHKRLTLTTTEGGMIAFPSFHVIWAILFAYACRNQKYLYYAMIVLNILVIASTLFLAWHYLADVIGGILVAWVSIWLSYKL